MEERGTLMLVDDEDFIRQLARDILQMKGYTIIEASHGKEAVDLYAEQKDSIDLVIMDMAMPVMGGKETFIKLKEINANVKVVFATGFAKDGESEEMIANGVRAFIEKPYRIEDLASIINSVLSSP